MNGRQLKALRPPDQSCPERSTNTPTELLTPTIHLPTTKDSKELTAYKCFQHTNRMLMYVCVHIHVWIYHVLNLHNYVHIPRTLMSHCGESKMLPSIWEVAIIYASFKIWQIDDANSKQLLSKQINSLIHK